MATVDEYKLEGFAFFLAVVFVFFLPPAAVFIKRKDFDTSFWINVILCFLAWLPASLHAIYVLFFKKEDY